MGFVLGIWMAMTCAQAADTPEVPTPAAAGVSRTWLLSGPAGRQLVFRGEANFSGVGAAPLQMLYPAAGLGGLIAAVLTHGAISEAAKNSQKDKLQEDADRVVVRYRSALERFDTFELMQRGVAKSRRGADLRVDAGGSPVAGDWTIASTPVFVITQDESAIVLQNTVIVRAPGSAGPDAAPAYRNTIRVVSRPRGTDTTTDFWLSGEAEKLKDESALLMAESLDIVVSALDAAASSPVVTERTFRYREGNVEKIERAQLVAERCDRVLIKTLRGSLISFPSTASTCDQLTVQPPAR